jgi:hypothetical protein
MEDRRPLQGRNARQDASNFPEAGARRVRWPFSWLLQRLKGKRYVRGIAGAPDADALRGESAASWDRGAPAADALGCECPPAPAVGRRLLLYFAPKGIRTRRCGLRSGSQAQSRAGFSASPQSEPRCGRQPFGAKSRRRHPPQADAGGHSPRRAAGRAGARQVAARHAIKQSGRSRSRNRAKNLFSQTPGNCAEAVPTLG